ncbi:class I SAM-dependent methyltransferase [Asaia krungthepensis]|uniref:SAM-dependent methyltransferase n=1 Tax=Asaia krungthepensis NRIC 0535 TaxID=1307925 RepID=A0ABQ0PYE5_9PROT|nr:class I SAM-dependent methyltransferase [Asaia krungthepensis]GBQ84664.1 SAM-dependent methyltransferase [Asaia krungthepensis NRIC 0535]
MPKRIAQPIPPDAAGFYASRRGEQVTSLLMARLAPLLPDPRGLRVLGLGFAQPLLAQWRGLDEAKWVASAQLDTPLTRRHGTSFSNLPSWPSCLVAPDCLPFDDLSIDLVVMVHGLELVDPQPLLRMVWKLLADHGRLVLVVPNRTGLAAKDDTLPFGHGSPFSASQLDRALHRGLFRVEASASALSAPLGLLSLGEKTALIADKAVGALGRRLGGVHLVNACKDLYSGMPVEAERATLGFARRVTTLASSARSYPNLPKRRKA